MGTRATWPKEVGKQNRQSQDIFRRGLHNYEGINQPSSTHPLLNKTTCFTKYPGLQLPRVPPGRTCPTLLWMASVPCVLSIVQVKRTISLPQLWRLLRGSIKNTAVSLMLDKTSVCPQEYWIISLELADPPPLWGIMLSAFQVLVFILITNLCCWHY